MLSYIDCNFIAWATDETNERLRHGIKRPPKTVYRVPGGLFTQVKTRMQHTQVCGLLRSVMDRSRGVGCVCVCAIPQSIFLPIEQWKVGYQCGCDMPHPLCKVNRKVLDLSLMSIRCPQSGHCLPSTIIDWSWHWDCLQSLSQCLASQYIWAFLVPIMLWYDMDACKSSKQHFDRYCFILKLETDGTFYTVHALEKCNYMEGWNPPPYLIQLL